MSSISKGNLPFPSWELTSIEANETLGKFVTAWGQVETVCSFIFNALSEVPATARLTLFGWVQTYEQIQILSALAEETDESALRDAISEVKDLSEKRNRIIHAEWGTIDGKEARFWRGLTIKALDQIAKETNPSRRTGSVFTLQEIKAFTENAVSLRDKLIEINQNIAQTSRLARLMRARARLEATRELPSNGKPPTMPPS